MKEIILALGGALITGVCAIIGNWIITNKNKTELYHKLDKQDEKFAGELALYKETTNLRLRHIEEKIDLHYTEIKKHNGFAERVPIVEEQIKGVNHRIADLERKVS